MKRALLTTMFLALGTYAEAQLPECALPPSSISIQGTKLKAGVFRIAYRVGEYEDCVRRSPALVVSGRDIGHADRHVENGDHSVLWTWDRVPDVSEDDVIVVTQGRFQTATEVGRRRAFTLSNANGATVNSCDDQPLNGRE